MKDSEKVAYMRFVYIARFKCFVRKCRAPPTSSKYNGTAFLRFFHVHSHDFKPHLLRWSRLPVAGKSLCDLWHVVTGCSCL